MTQPEEPETLVDLYILDPDVRSISVGSLDNITPDAKRQVRVAELVAVYLVSTRPDLFSRTPPAKAKPAASTPSSEE